MIKKIYIENFKSIKKVDFIFNKKQDIVCLIGKNGSGKSNIFKAIKYFFDYINKPYSEEIIIDNSNPYLQKCIISITFDLKLLREKSKYNNELRNKFKNIEKYVNEYLYKDNTNSYTLNNFELELKMVQYKDGAIKWNVENKRICETLKSLFPLYSINTRYLDLYTWKQLWKIISDLSATMPQKDIYEYRSILDEAFAKIYGNKYTSSKSRIEKVFENNKISLDPYHFDSKYKNAFSMRFGGEHFLVDGQPLSYFSDGTNSFKYLILLSTLIPQISEISCKYPIIIFDEPEIGLHSEFITKFVECICKNIKNNALMLFSTHSPKLISDMTNCRVSFQLYKINKIGIHSKIYKMNTSWLTSSKHKITTKETECYFYDYLVYLEGETEVELFNHIKIKKLFSSLENIHFYSFDANHSRLESVNADNINLGVEYRLITDMDQILSYSKKRNKFKLTGDSINPLKDKKTLKESKIRYFNKNSPDFMGIHNNIIDLLEVNHIKTKNYIDNKQFNSLMMNVKKYCRYHNIIVNWSTIEGELITYENIDKFIEYISTKKIKHEDQHNEILKLPDKKEKTVLIMCEYDGKTEFFEQKNNIKINDTSIKPLIPGKTCGWVSDWLDFYFEKYIDILENTNEKRAHFKQDFPNLFNTLQDLESMVQ